MDHDRTNDYEAPAIESREPVRSPLIGIPSGPVASPVWRRPEADTGD